MSTWNSKRRRSWVALTQAKWYGRAEQPFVNVWVVEKGYEKGRVVPSCRGDDDILVSVETEEGFVGSMMNFQGEELFCRHW